MNTSYDTDRLPRKVKPEGADGHRQRMIMKFLNSYENGFFKRDIVEILLYYPIRIRDTRDIAVRVMKDNGDDVYSVLSASQEKLCSSPGIGPSCAVLIRLVGEIVRRLNDNAPTPEKSEFPKKEGDQRIGTIYDLLEIAKSSNRDQLHIAYHSADKLICVKSFPLSMCNDLQSRVSAILKQACISHSDSITVIRSTSSVPITSPLDFSLYNCIGAALSNTGLQLDGYYIAGKNKIFMANTD